MNTFFCYFTALVFGVILVIMTIEYYEDTPPINLPSIPITAEYARSLYEGNIDTTEETIKSIDTRILFKAKEDRNTVFLLNKTDDSQNLVKHYLDKGFIVYLRNDFLRLAW